MNKNMILLLGIILIFLLIIRPTSKASESTTTDNTENENLENELTYASNNAYVEQSKANNEKTEQEVTGSNVTK